MCVFMLGPDLPKELWKFAMVKLKDTVVAVGGFGSDGESNSLYRLDCSNQGCEWKEMVQKLSFARYLHVAIMIPDEIANCRKSQ